MTPPSVRLRSACALGASLILAALAAAGLGAGAAAAEPAPSPVTPIVDCVQDASLGAVTARTVVLGYRSTATADVTLPPGGGANDLTSTPADRGQPTTFRPGEHHGVWLLTVDAAAEPGLGWRLDGTTAAIDATAPSCTTATSVALSAPATATAGSTLAVSAAVTRALLAPPADGSVEFSLDGSVVARVPVAAGTARAELTPPAAGAHTLTAEYRPVAGSDLRAASASAALTVVPAPGPLAIAADSVVTGSAAARVVISRSPAIGAATVEFTTVDGTARAGADYTATTGTITLADGQAEASAAIPLAARAPGTPASTFFVVLRRASADVGTAVAVVALPAVPATLAPTAVSPGAAPGASALAVTGPASALPQGDPTATADSAVGASQNLVLLVGAALLTAAGIATVIGMLRAVGARHPS